jgi:hypothetical protein
MLIDQFDDLLKSGQASCIQQAGKWHLQKNCEGARGRQRLSASSGNGAPPLLFAPSLRGWFDIYVGCFSRGNLARKDAERSGIYLRQNDEKYFCYLEPERSEPVYEELYYKTARMDGKAIEIANFDRHSAFDYVKFVPSSEPHLPPPDSDLIGLLDFADDADTSEPPLQEAASAVYQHALAGYSSIWWKVYAVRCEYHTAIGSMRTTSHGDGSTSGIPTKGVGALLRQYDTMRQAVQTAREQKLLIFGWVRISNETSLAGHQFCADTPFHQAHPDAVQCSREGVKSPRLSFAYEAVRRHKIDLICEMAAYGMDGIAIDVLRHPPMVDYDLPVVEAFLLQTDQDPRRMENDGSEEWLRFRAEVFTQFLRETRAVLHSQSEKPVSLVLRIFDQPWSNLKAGCDVETWMREGLVDGLLLAPHLATAGDYPNHMDVRPFVEMSQKYSGGRIKIWGQVWRYGSGYHAAMLAKSLYDQGVNGVAFYESNHTVFAAALRRELWRFGRRGEIGKISL